MCSFTCGICLSGLCVCSRKATHTATFRLKGKHTQMKIILPTYANGKDTLFFATCVTDPKETLIFVTKVRAFTVAPVHYSQPPAVKAKARESLPLPFFVSCHWDYSVGGLVMERFSCTTLRTNIRPASVHTVVRNNPVRPSLR